MYKKYNINEILFAVDEINSKNNKKNFLPLPKKNNSFVPKDVEKIIKEAEENLIKREILT